MNFLKYPVFLIGIGCIIFYSTLFIGFALDDYPQIVNRPLVHALGNVPLFFISSFGTLKKSDSVLSTYHYRPLQFTLYSLLYTVGNGNALYFHIAQLAIYIINVILIYYFLTSFFTQRLSFFLALIFLVHPANETVAAYIAELPDSLYFLFGIIALLVVKNTKNRWQAAIISSLLLLLSLFSKESGVLFIGVTILWSILFRKRMIKAFIIPLACITTLYLFTRSIASYHYLFTLKGGAHMDTTFITRLLLAPQIIFFYIKELLIPTLPVPSPQEFKSNLTNDIIPLFTIVLIIGVLIFFGFWLRKFKKRQFTIFLFFSLWFIVGIIFHSQLIPFDVLVAKRWLYFPLVGTLGMIGIAVDNLKIIPKRWKIACIALFILLIISYALMTIRLNFYWNYWKIWYYKYTPTS